MPIWDFAAMPPGIEICPVCKSRPALDSGLCAICSKPDSFESLCEWCESEPKRAGQPWCSACCRHYDRLVHENQV
jgi:hypothetical protein